MKRSRSVSVHVVRVVEEDARHVQMSLATPEGGVCAEFVKQAFLACFPDAQFSTGDLLDQFNQQLDSSQAVGQEEEEVVVLRFRRKDEEDTREGDRAWFARCGACGTLSPLLPCEVKGDTVLCGLCGHGKRTRFNPLRRMDVFTHLVVDQLHVENRQFVEFLAQHVQPQGVKEKMSMMLCLAEARGKNIARDEFDWVKRSGDAFSVCRALALGERWLMEHHSDLNDPTSHRALRGVREDQGSWFRTAFPPKQVDCSQIVFQSKEMFIVHPGNVVLTLQQMSFSWKDESFLVAPRRVFPPNQFCMWLEESVDEGGFWERPSPAWNPVLEHVLAVPMKHCIAVYDMQKKIRLYEVKVEEKMTCLEWSLRGSLYVCFESGRMAIVARGGGWKYVEIPRSCLRYDGQTREVCWKLCAHPVEDGLFAGMWVINNKHKELRVWRGNVILFSCSLRGRLKGDVCQWSPDGGEWLAFKDGRFLRIWSRKTGMVEVVSKASESECAGWRNKNELTVLPSRSCSDFFVNVSCPGVVVMYCRTCVHVFDEKTCLLLKTISPMQDVMTGNVQGVALNPRNGRLAVVFTNDELLVDWDVRLADKDSSGVVNEFEDGAMQVQAAVGNQREPVDWRRIVIESSATKKRGSRGKVMFGTYRGKAVAVKKCGINQLPNAVELYNIACMERHRNLVFYYGYYTMPTAVHRELHIVTEWMEGGTLKRFLKGNTLTEFQRVHIALSVARALEWMHDQGLVHGDLKTDNIVGDLDFWTVKLIDFGCTKRNSDQMRNSGLHYKEGQDDLQVFKKHVLDPVWGGNASVCDALHAKEDLGGLISWLELYRIYLLRHAPFRARLISSFVQPQMVDLTQWRGTFVRGEVEQHLTRAGALVTNSYRLVKLDCGVTKCFVASCDPGNGDPLSVELEGTLSKVSLLPIEKEGRAAHFDEQLKGYTESKTFYLRFFGPVLVYEDTSCNMAHLVREGTIDIHDADFDAVCPKNDRIPSRLRHWESGRVPCSRNEEVAPWCLDIE